MMKNIVLTLQVILLAVLLTGCRSFDETLLTRQAHIDKSVPSLKLIVNMASIKSCFPKNLGSGPVAPIPLSEEFQEVIGNVLKNNLSFDGTPVNGYLSVVIRKCEFVKNPVYLFLGSISLGTLYFIGWPGFSMNFTVNIEAAILDINGKVLKTYTVSANDTEYFAMYWGFGGEFENLAYVQSIRFASEGLRKQLMDDAENINNIIKPR